MVRLCSADWNGELILKLTGDETELTSPLVDVFELTSSPGDAVELTSSPGDVIEFIPLAGEVLAFLLCIEEERRLEGNEC